MAFDYLGAKITSNKDLQSKVKVQTTKAAIVSRLLRDLIWRNKHISIDSKVRIYKTCVRLIMTYAVETRAETRITKRLLRTTEIKTLRQIIGCTLRDRVRNDDIKQRCKMW